MPYPLAIFDMDGTILDTLEDLQDSLNYALAQHGYPVRSYVQVRRAVGNGIRTLIVRSLPDGTEEATIEAVFQTFMPHYQAHCADKTRPYAGINEVILHLRRSGVLCAVLSNKADAAVQSLCASYFPDCFDLAAGERPGIPRKPAPDAVHSLLETLHIPPEGAVYIGDSEVDFATAQNAGVDCIMVTWGFRDRPELEALGAEVFVDTPKALLPLLLE